MLASTVLTLDQMDFDAIFQQINQSLSRKLYALQNLALKNPLPGSFACFFDPSELSAILCVLSGNPLRAVFSKIEIFLATAKYSTLYARASRVPPRVLAVWAKTLRGQLLLSVNFAF